MLTAIKIYDKVKLSDQSRKKSVLREITILKKLQNPALPILYDVIDSPSQLYLVMEFVHGQNLNSWIKRSVEDGTKLSLLDERSDCVTESQAAMIISQVLQGL